MLQLTALPHQVHKLAMSPRQQQAVKLLQMSSLDFQQVLQNAVANNPFIECTDIDGIASANDAADGMDDDTTAPCDGMDEASWLDAPKHAPVANGDALEDRCAHSPTLADHLMAQLDLLRLSERERELARLVAASLEDDGYLRTSFDELAMATLLADWPGQPDEDEWRIALCRVQSLEPAGVGARDLAECLRLQVRAMAPGPQQALSMRALDHLGRVAASDVQTLSALLDASGADVRGALACIRRLDPHPGWSVNPPPVQYVVPDMRVVRNRSGEWTVQPNHRAVPRLRVNHDYVDAARRAGIDAGSALDGQIREATWTVRNIEQRISTILSVAQAIVRHQQGFFEHGPLALRPLALAQIAEDVGVHESTVCRVTNNKFMETPHGVMELKKFFSRAMRLSGGGECSPAAIRELIGAMVAAEPSDAPVTDADLTRQLERQGVKVARRTVTKYRQDLRIEPAERRKARNSMPVWRFG